MVVTEDRKSILDMVASGKVTAAEGERLLAALDSGQAAEAAPRGPLPKYLRIIVEQNDGDDGPLKVNVRVPLQLLRAGVKLVSLIPPRATQEVNTALAREGLSFDLSQLKPENLDELIDQLRELTVDVDQPSDGLKVRMFCE